MTSTNSPSLFDSPTSIHFRYTGTLRGLVCAGLNAVFAQHHKPEIAR